MNAVVRNHGPYDLTMHGGLFESGQGRGPERNSDGTDMMLGTHISLTLYMLKIDTEQTTRNLDAKRNHIADNKVSRTASERTVVVTIGLLSER
jgi:hypothetical protein